MLDDVEQRYPARHPGRNEKSLGKRADDYLSTPGSLRVGPDNIANIHLGNAGSKSYEESAP